MRVDQNQKLVWLSSEKAHELRENAESMMSWVYTLDNPLRG